jgi:pyruvate/2-oxoglutarate dehydrogenase complex dihydrolipoamide acyltransferase (E2) component
VATFFEADFSGVAGFREGRALTYLPFVVSAVTRAISEHPLLNSSWREQGLVMKNDMHIGIAVALDDGLLVPVIRHADRKGLNQIAHEITDLAERARSKRLRPEEVQDGTFTITNHGGFGSLFSTPIINQPQTAILGVGSVQKRAVVINDAIAHALNAAVLFALIEDLAQLNAVFAQIVDDLGFSDGFLALQERAKARRLDLRFLHVLELREHLFRRALLLL